MKPVIKTIFNTIVMLLLTTVAVTACSSNPYGDPDDQRSRSKDAQDEMRRDTSR